MSAKGTTVKLISRSSLLLPVVVFALSGCTKDDGSSSKDSAKRASRATACAHCITDDFSAAKNGWPTKSNDREQIGRVDGEYVVGLKVPAFNKFVGPDQ